MLTKVKNLSSISHLLEENFSISILDRNGIFVFVSPKFCDLSKYEEKELIGESYNKLIPDYPFEIFLHEIHQEIMAHQICLRKIKRTAKDGSFCWVQATIIPVFDDNKQVTQYVSFDINITPKVHTEKKYESTLRNFHAIENALNQSSVVAITNQRGIITYVNQTFCELSKYSESELIGQTHQILNSGYHSKSFFKEMWRTIGMGGIWKGEVKNRAKDGTEYWVNTTIVPFLNDKGKPHQYISIRTDITDRKAAEHSLQIALKNDFRQTVKSLQNAVFKYMNGDKGKMTFTLFEGKLAKKLGITVENVIGNTFDYPFTQKEFRKLIRNLRKGLQGQAIHFEVTLSQDTFLIYLSPIFQEGGVVEVVGTMIDISGRKKAEKRIEHMAYYDYLTKLPNRRLFQQKVHEAILQAEEEGSIFGILFLDLDRFKHINDTLGHSIGDKILKKVAQRLNKFQKTKNFIARHGGDEFIILIPSAQLAEIHSLADEIIKELSLPFVIENREAATSPSIGISLFPEDGGDHDTLMRKADAAMYMAKNQGRGTYRFFTKEMEHEITYKAMLESDLRLALQKNQLMLYYQPQMNLKTGRLSGFEALVRWNHPTKGMIPPSEFIPIAEETGLIAPIGQFILEQACVQTKKWQDAGYPSVQMSVNVSIFQFQKPAFVAQVQETLSKTELDPEYLNLEITESMTSNVLLCQRVLHQLRDIGVNISIDDFGTGYSSLIYLSKFPITHLKIDQAFVQELNSGNRAIVKTIITLARNLNLQVIAEGVETEEQILFLKELKCDEAQGYFYSKPLPSEQIEKQYKLNL